MVKSENKIRNAGCLRLRGYRVVALKPEFDELTTELEQALEEGIPAYPDLARADFYDVELEDRWAYIHVYETGRTVYLVAHSATQSAYRPKCRDMQTSYVASRV